MAGPRPKYASLKAKWLAEQPAKMQAFHKMLKENIPEKDVAIVGWKNLIQFLHDLGVRRPNAFADVNDVQIRRWQRDHGFPLVRGQLRPRPQAHAPCVSTTYAVMAWLLSQPLNGPLFSTLSPLDVKDNIHLGFRPLQRGASMRGRAA